MDERLAAVEALDVIAADFWRGRRVFVTGHTGFKGGWLVLWLRTLGAEVAGYALAPEPGPSLFAAAAIDEGIDDGRGDVTDAAALRRQMDAFDPEIVFHLAAMAIVRRGYREPLATYATNVVGTAALLDACRHAASLRAIVCVTSDKCYENREWVWPYRENDRLGGYDPYSSSKACAELVTQAYRRSFFDEQIGVGIGTARAGNVIGGGDWAEDRLVPDLVRALAAAETANIRRPGAVRPWQHVLEPLSGYLQLAQALSADPKRYEGAWNFGPDPSSFQTVEAVVAALARRWGGDLRWQVDGGEHPHEAARLVLDSSRANQELGWQPRLPLADALAWTAEWYEAWRTGSDGLRALCEAQIARYCAEDDKSQC